MGGGRLLGSVWAFLFEDIELHMSIEPLDIDRYKNIVVLTGAGISVASGLRPFRGPDGIWEESDVAQLANASAIETHPAAVWGLFGPLRETAKLAVPNPAHQALVQLENSLRSNQTLTLITQNIDRLHQRAGSRNVVELHGSIFRTRCHNHQCSLEPYEDDLTHTDTVPQCPLCSSTLRPDIVLFGEPIPLNEEWRVKRALRECDLFVAIGTSGTVSPASNYVRSAQYSGAFTIYVNREKMNPPNPYFAQEVIGKAEEVLPQLFRAK